jgi:hypothetical protein
MYMYEAEEKVHSFFVRRSNCALLKCQNSVPWKYEVTSRQPTQGMSE